MTVQVENGNVVHYRGARSSPNCATCPCAVNGKPREKGVVPGFGAAGGLVVVGEAPSTEEFAQGYPFVGPSGRELNRVLRRGNIDRNRLYIANALLCQRPASDADMLRAVDCCRPRLEAELQALGPSTVLALGGTATRALKLRATAIMDARGTVQDSPLVPGVPVVTSIHPAALLRGGAGEVSGGNQKQNVDSQMMFLQADVEKAYGISEGKIPATWSDDIEVVVEPYAQPQPEDTRAEDETTLNQRFLDFQARNPQVYRLLVDLARQRRAVGRERIGIRNLWEVMRWNLGVSTSDPDFKLNDNYTSRYARLIMAQESDLADAFETRNLRS